uniref:DUF19 domain-containing protein n=1 Tax=Trichuris muris TaxID=70415 RepID=A0A5S6PZZ9_TRIMR
MAPLRASLLILSVSLAAVLADFACKDEFGSYFQCFSGHVKTLLSNTSDWEERKASALDCFTSSGCKKPSLNYDEDISKQSTTDRSHSETFLKCVKETVKDMVNRAEQCIAAEVPGFEFAKLPGEGDIDGSIGKSYAYAIMKISTSISNPEICPGDAQQKVKDCLKKISDGRKEIQQSHLKHICDEREECLSKISENCRQLFHKSRNLLKKCSCEETGMDEHKAKMIKCLSDDVDNKKKEAMANILHRVHEKYCKRVEKLRKICDRA